MSMGQFLQDLQDLAASTITIAPWASVDKSNQASYNSAVSYIAQISGPVEFFHRESGQKRISTQTVYVFSDAAISARDKLTLPPGYDASVTTPKILQVERKTDELGFCYTVLFLG